MELILLFIIKLGYSHVIVPLFYLFCGYSWLLCTIRWCQLGLRILYWYHGNYTYVGGKRVILHSTLPVLLMAPKTIIDSTLVTAELAAVPLALEASPKDKEAADALVSADKNTQDLWIVDEDDTPLTTFELPVHNAAAIIAAPMAGISLAAWSRVHYLTLEETLFQRILQFADTQRAAGNPLTEAQQEELLKELFNIALGNTAIWTLTGLAGGGLLFYLLAGPLPLVGLGTSWAGSYIVQLAMLAAGCPPETVKVTSSLVSFLIGHLFTNIALSTVEKSYDQSTLVLPMALKNIKEDDRQVPSLVPITSIDINDPSNKDQCWYILRSVDPNNRYDLDSAIYEPISWEELQKHWELLTW